MGAKARRAETAIIDRNGKIEALDKKLTLPIELFVADENWRAMEFAALFQVRATGRVASLEISEFAVLLLPVGGVGGPVTTRSPAGSNSCGGPKAKDVSEERRWDLTGQLVGGGHTHPPGFDADTPQPDTERPGGQMLAGVNAASDAIVSTTRC